MKKCIFLISALAVLLCASCSKDEQAIISGVENVKIYARIVSDEPTTKVALGESADGKTKVEWTSGDDFLLTIGEDSYVFNWVSGDEFEYDGNNGPFPSTFAASATITATYPADGAKALTSQSGSKADVGDFMQLASELNVQSGQSTEGINLSFKHSTSVVSIKLTDAAFVDKEVNVSLNATGLLGIGSNSITTSAPLVANNEGMVEAWFAVPSTTSELNDWYISAGCGDDYYYTPLGDRQLVSGQLYQVDKSDMVKTHTISTVTETYYNTDYELKHYTVYHYIGLYAWAKAAEAADAPVDSKYYPVHLTLEADIQLPVDGISVIDGIPSSSNWTPVGQTNGYIGKVDGKGHTISGLRIRALEEQQIGFFKRISTEDVASDRGDYFMIGTVRNLNFDDAAICGHHISGVMAGRIEARATISDCSITNSYVTIPSEVDANDKGKIAGGFIGQVVGNNDVITNPKYTYRILVSNCTFDGSVKGAWHIGGIAGTLTGSATIINCTNKGEITANSLNSGGIVGSAHPNDGYPRIEKCINQGKVTTLDPSISANGIGGIVGNIQGTTRVIACTNEGEVSATTTTYSYLGGVVGYIKDDTHWTSAWDAPLVAACINKSTEVRGSLTNHYGGIVGKLDHSEGKVLGCYTVQSSNKGDLFGAEAISGSVAFGELSGCYHSNDAASSSEKVTNMNTAIASGHANAITIAEQRAPSSAYARGIYVSYAGCEYRWNWESGEYPTIMPL
ncbi:MAG: hypothetical protein II318_03105 [Bacteroidales bacterium]|nr:hypothetical protein [Bacteroidales bacterium]